MSCSSVVGTVGTYRSGGHTTGSRGGGDGRRRPAAGRPGGGGRDRGTPHGGSPRSGPRPGCPRRTAASPAGRLGNRPWARRGSADKVRVVQGKGVCGSVDFGVLGI